jgi:hypothetical protein
MSEETREQIEQAESDSRKAAKIASLKATIELTKSGFAGMSKSGMIVDRRTHPEASIIEANGFLGIGAPKHITAQDSTPRHT